eukprot:7400769-Pyramimonas_sp.AAC.1
MTRVAEELDAAEARNALLEAGAQAAVRRALADRRTAEAVAKRASAVSAGAMGRALGGVSDDGQRAQSIARAASANNFRAAAEVRDAMGRIPRIE